jgi:hypothetical protein
MLALAPRAAIGKPVAVARPVLLAELETIGCGCAPDPIAAPIRKPTIVGRQFADLLLG